MTEESEEQHIDATVEEYQARLGFGPSPLVTLEGVTAGVYLVTTKSGTRHVLDLDNRLAFRQGRKEHEWNSATKRDVTPDGSPFYIIAIGGAAVGKRMWLDSRDEWRLSSMIVRIEPFERRHGNAVDEPDVSDL